ncbi:MAG TPA: cbb3-type cytochrome c oxidase subunit I, partial [Terriglobales bacterium]
MSIGERTLANQESDFARHERLERTWSNSGGFWGFIKNVDHKTIGKRFFATSFIFFLFAGVLAGMMRLQLIRPENGMIGPDLYNQLFTVHGSTMMFLFAVPMMSQSFSVYFVPLICGARNIAFPRVVAYAYW